MTQTLNDVTGTTTVQPAAKQAWTTPSIETYDVAQFTLGFGNGTTDGGSNHS